MLWTASVTCFDPFKELMAVSDADDEFSQDEVPRSSSGREQHPGADPLAGEVQPSGEVHGGRRALLQWDDGQ